MNELFHKRLSEVLSTMPDKDFETYMSAPCDETLDYLLGLCISMPLKITKCPTCHVTDISNSKDIVRSALACLDMNYRQYLELMIFINTESPTKKEFLDYVRGLGVPF